PAVHPNAERYGTLSYALAHEASAGLIQPKAIDAARAADVAIEVAAIGHHEATVIADLPARRAVPLAFPKLRVALLGCGAVGAGVLSYLQERPDLFEVGPVLVRRPAAHAPIGDEVYTDSLDEALSIEPDLLIEAIGGADYPAEIMCLALKHGTHVVTANKAALAKHYDALHACAEAGEASLLYSSAVGGGAPILETVERLRRQGGVVGIEGVMNGTCNFLLDRLAAGAAFD